MIKKIINRSDLLVQQIWTGCLSQYSYLITSKDSSFVIDPIRDINMYLDLAKENGSSIKGIYNTHIHADFVSGYVDMSTKTNAPIILGPNCPDEFGIKPTEDGTVFNLGTYKFKLIHTPGHTLESSCFLLEEEGNSDPLAVFTGDTVFLGEVGRPDLAQKSDLTIDDLAGMMFESLKKIKVLPDDTLVLPCHGAGSSCGKEISTGNKSTIKEQKLTNIPFSMEDKSEFLREVTEGLKTPPDYFSTNVALNKQRDIESIDQILKRGRKGLSADKVENMMKENKIIILDSREGNEFDKAHIPKSLHCPLGGKFAIWATYIANFEDKIVLVTDEGIIDVNHRQFGCHNYKIVQNWYR